MKKSIILFFILISCSLSFSQTCQEIFVSEVVFSKDSTQTLLGSSTTWIENYALELYNPTTADIDLSQYSIQLIPQIGNPTIITLTDSIRAEATYVIAKLGADYDLTSISELITNSLDYDNFVAIELYKDNTLIDKIGQTGLTIPDNIDLAQAIADPANYLSSLNIDLTSIEQLIFRRSPMIGKGNPDFDSLSKEWYVVPNADYTDVHHHTNICKETDVIVEFTNEVYYATEGIKVYPTITFYNYNNTTMQGTITVSIQQVPNPPYTLSNPYYASVNEIGPTTTILGLPSFVADILPMIDNQIEPTEIMMYKLSVVPIIQQGTAYFNAKVNPAKQYTTIVIQDNLFSAIENTETTQNISIYPNPSNESIYIQNLTNEPIKEITIYDIVGKELLNVPYINNKIDIRQLIAGQYILTIKQENKTMNKYFIKSN